MAQQILSRFIAVLTGTFFLISGCGSDSAEKSTAVTTNNSTCYLDAKVSGEITKEYSSQDKTLGCGSSMSKVFSAGNSIVDPSIPMLRLTFKEALGALETGDKALEHVEISTGKLSDETNATWKIDGPGCSAEVTKNEENTTRASQTSKTYDVRISVVCTEVATAKDGIATGEVTLGSFTLGLFFTEKK